MLIAKPSMFTWNTTTAADYINNDYFTDRVAGGFIERRIASRSNKSNTSCSAFFTPEQQLITSS